MAGRITPTEPDATAWEEVYSLAMPSLGNFLRRLAKSGGSIPEVSFEMTDESGEVIAEAELGWPGVKVAIIADWQKEFEATLEGLGWRVYQLHDATDRPEKVIEALKG